MPRNAAPVIVHVNQHVIRHNAKHGTSYPTLTIKLPESSSFRRSRKAPATIYAHEVGGIGRVIDSNARGRNALSCGARVWMEFAADTFFVEGDWCDWPTLRERLRAAHDELSEDTSGLRLALGEAVG
jgi:hypothetical protein